MKTLWKYNKHTGYWINQRKCLNGEWLAWLKIYESDEPNEYFYVTAGHRPSHKPIPKEVT